MRKPGPLPIQNGFGQRMLLRLAAGPVRPYLTAKVGGAISVPGEPGCSIRLGQGPIHRRREILQRPLSYLAHSFQCEHMFLDESLLLSETPRVSSPPTRQVESWQGASCSMRGKAMLTIGRPPHGQMACLWATLSEAAPSAARRQPPPLSPAGSLWLRVLRTAHGWGQ